jgi:hypothetical protein
MDISTVIDIARFNWSSLKRTTAYVSRQFSNFQRPKAEWNREFLSTLELIQAERKWIVSFQFRFFANEYEYLRGDHKGRRPALISLLDLYLDADSIIRCRGRLNNADLSSDARNPILLPKNTELTRLIIQHFHERTLHSGVSYTISSIRQRFWIPSIRQQVKAIVRLCTRCRRVNGAPYRAPNPATFPSFGVRRDKGFTVTGIVFAGPFPVHGLPGHPESKEYICLFFYIRDRHSFLK